MKKNDAEYKNNIKWIIPNAQKNSMEPLLLTLEADGSTYPDNPHEGEEFGYVLSGAVSIHLGNKIYKAKRGNPSTTGPIKPIFSPAKTALP